MKRVILIFAFILVATSSVFAWGREAHEVIARIAENNLKPGVKKKIESYLGHSIVYYAKWMDEYRYTPKYNFTDAWHSCNVDEQLKYVSRSKGDFIHGLDYATGNLREYRSLSDSAVASHSSPAQEFQRDLAREAHLEACRRGGSCRVSRRA